MLAIFYYVIAYIHIQFCLVSHSFDLNCNVACIILPRNDVLARDFVALRQFVF